MPLLGRRFKSLHEVTSFIFFFIHESSKVLPEKKIGHALKSESDKLKINFWYNYVPNIAEDILTLDNNNNHLLFI